MARKLIILVLVVAVVFFVWTVSVVGALAEAWAKVLPTPTDNDAGSSLTLDRDAVPQRETVIESPISSVADAAHLPS